MGILFHLITMAVKSLIDDWNAVKDMAPWYIRLDQPTSLTDN